MQRAWPTAQFLWPAWALWVTLQAVCMLASPTLLVRSQVVGLVGLSPANRPAPSLHLAMQ